MRTVTRFVSGRLTNKARFVFLILVCVAGASPRAAAQTTTVDLDGLLLSVSASRTAQLFHIVDQLSEWNQFTHKGYGRWAARTALLDQSARDRLKQHADLRRVRGWVAQRVMAGAGTSDAFVRFDMLATVIRPLLREALDQRDSITAFLPKFSARWRTVANTQRK